jgi:Mor family transcriptional regulator
MLKDTILENDYMELIDTVKVSERNKEIVKKYIRGIKMKALSEEYNVSYERIRAIIYNYIWHCHHYKKHINKK